MHSRLRRRVHRIPFIKNPQANAICERMHQTMASQLRSILHLNPPVNVQEASQIIDSAIASTIFAFRSTIHTTLKTTPGALVFNRDMLLNIPFIADLQAIKANRQQVVNKNLQRENIRRFDFDYEINGKVLIKNNDPRKLDSIYQGHFTIQREHANKDVTIIRRPGVTKRINIRRLKPYRGTTI